MHIWLGLKDSSEQVLVHFEYFRQTVKLKATFPALAFKLYRMINFSQAWCSTDSYFESVKTCTVFFLWCVVIFFFNQAISCLDWFLLWLFRKMKMYAFSNLTLFFQLSSHFLTHILFQLLTLAEHLVDVLAVFSFISRILHIGTFLDAV